ncbi:MAG: glycosyltransferase [Cyanobacteria bacterium]|jgi:glycosyltransferase involved in cell wall biosynthesis|nr:glycosyltransferase [Cyanobacteria bacterium GSL.Bin21]
MKVLLIHNQYQQLGGEDTIFTTEANLLESYGHPVYRYLLNNHKLQKMNSLAITKATLWNSQVYQELRTLIRQNKPQVAHFHNTFPLISPAAYYAAQAEGIPVIQTLHNFRLLCANGLFFRDGRICEDCLHYHNPLPGMLHACYRNNRIATTAATLMVKFHSLLNTWSKAIDYFIIYSKFAQEKFIKSGLPEEKIAFKTNFLYPAPEIGTGDGDYALFVGRLAPEKGTNTLLQAWKKLQGKIPLKIVGDGPLANQIATEAANLNGVEWLKRQPLEEIYQLMGKAKCVIIPSEWYETFGRVGIEALAKGTPLIVTKIGALAELVQHKYNGLHFRLADPEDLATQVQWLLDHPLELNEMRHNARCEFEAKYTATANYQRLMEIYQWAIANKGFQRDTALK